MSAGARRRPRGSRAQPLAPLCCFSAALGMLWSPASQAFNLDVDKLTVYSGPEGSYFGYAVDFHIPAARTPSVLVGAPKANTSQPDIVEGGAVYYCPWPAEGSAQCKQIPFDNTIMTSGTSGFPLPTILNKTDVSEINSKVAANPFLEERAHNTNKIMFSNILSMKSQVNYGIITQVNVM